MGGKPSQGRVKLQPNVRHATEPTRVWLRIAEAVRWSRTYVPRPGVLRKTPPEPARYSGGSGGKRTSRIAAPDRLP
jgi:hypothetical protein